MNTTLKLAQTLLCFLLTHYAVYGQENAANTITLQPDKDKQPLIRIFTVSFPNILAAAFTKEFG